MADWANQKQVKVFFREDFWGIHYPRPVPRLISLVLLIIDVPTLWGRILVYSPVLPPPSRDSIDSKVYYIPKKTQHISHISFYSAKFNFCTIYAWAARA